MSTTHDYDVIAAEVHRKAMQNLTDEMAITLVRTSGSPIVTESKDFSTCLMDTVPEHLGFSVLRAVPRRLVADRHAGDRQSCERRAADLRPGDGWIVNDPHIGRRDAPGRRLGDHADLLRDEHLGWSFANMHVLDVGGVGISGYAPGAHDVWQEGMLFPPVRIIRDGAIDTEWEKYIAANVRAPGPVLNDIRSMIAANNTAQKKLNKIIDEFGLELAPRVLRDQQGPLRAGAARTDRANPGRRLRGGRLERVRRPRRPRPAARAAAASSRSTAPTCASTTRACRRSTPSSTRPWARCSARR